MQRLTYVICFFLIVCGQVIDSFWPFIREVGARALPPHDVSENSQKNLSTITYSWFLENPNEFVKGGSGNNDTKLIGNTIPCKIEDGGYKLYIDVPCNQKEHRDLLYLDQVGIWVKFHEYASNVDLSLKSTEEKNISINSRIKYKRLSEDQIKENLNNNSLIGDLGLHSLRRNGEKEGRFVHSFFQVISKDWLLGWRFICDYFKEFILK
ncbi:putative membrane with signal peptide and transmembrane domain [Cryptosporidium sp. chipmunk genotype I]|uniref:putative membrane with signal peptide and transmembrane domain n=1 Tax=Cryptosporidium sp. chipmunk genotype I TaxID=1280935 RepID=UPI003519FF76|nr:putative membrane with signal peptide and transmembrane domain [Cryptosporidium sp. chipmunk genotype I]